MGILSRFKDIMSANINDVLDKMEDPEKMVEEELRKATEDLAEARRETKRVMADEQMAKERLDKANEAVQAEHAKAVAAMKNNDEHAAEVFLQKEAEKEKAAATAKQNWEIAHANAEKMKQMHNKLASDIEALKERKNNIKSTAAMAKATERVNNMHVPDRDVIGKMDKWEEKANRRLAEANAGMELATEPATEYDEVNAKYSGATGADVSDRMAALRAEVSGS